MSDLSSRGKPITVGIGTRSYNATHSYAGLAPAGVRFVPAWRLPLNRLRPASLTALNTYVPLDPRLELLHLMNGVVAAGWPTPWLTSFESMLPRLDARHYGTRLDERLVERLLSDRCRGLLAWSNQAAAWLPEMHEPDVAAALAAKTQIFTGSTGSAVASSKSHELPLRVIFVGGELLRKGGIAVLRATALASAARLPIQFTVVGSPEGRTDVTPPWERYRDEARGLLQHVRWFERVEPAEALDLIGESHVLLFPTLQETLGWVTLEAMQRATVPVVAGIDVQRELIGAGGVVIDVERSASGRWIGLGADEVERERLAEVALDELTVGITDVLERFVNDPQDYERQSAAALAEYVKRFQPCVVAARLRQIYDHALG